MNNQFFCTLSWIESIEIVDFKIVAKTTSETYGPFESEEAANVWESALHPNVKHQPGYNAVISTPEIM